MSTSPSQVPGGPAGVSGPFINAEASRSGWECSIPAGAAPGEGVVTHQDDALWYDAETEEAATSRFPFWKFALTLVLTAVAVYLIV